jgi:hypothetical protein
METKRHCTEKKGQELKGSIGLMDYAAAGILRTRSAMAIETTATTRPANTSTP